MSVETLKIVITADNKQALDAMKQTVTSLDTVSTASNKTGAATQKLGSNFTGITRVIQDLPYGFNAIANNLEQIVPAAGMAGLAFSGLIAGLTFMQIGFGAWTRGIGENKKALEDAAKAHDDYLAALAKEQVNLDVLFKTATNANVPLKARLQAVKDLRDNYGAYLKDFSDEAIMAGKATSAYNSLAEAILKSSRARAAQDTMVEKQKQLLQLEEQATKLREKAVAGYKEVGKGGVETISAGPGMASVRITPEQRQMGVVSQFSREYQTIADNAGRIRREMDALVSTISTNTVNPFTEPKGGGGKGTTEKKDTFKSKWMQIRNENNVIANEDIANRQKQDALDQKELMSLKLKMDGNQAYNTIRQQQMEVNDKINANTALANSLTDVAVSGLSNLFNTMANGGNIGQALGDMFKKLAIDIALAAAKAAIFQAIFSALNPAGGAVGGGGGFLKGFGKLLGFAEGGTVSGPSTGYPVMLHGTEHIVRPDQMKSIIASASQMGNASGRIVVEGRIAGQDIWLSQQRTNTFRTLTT